jgi:hypothetical protein
VHGHNERAEEHNRLTRFFAETERRIRKRLSYPIMLWIWCIRRPSRHDFFTPPYQEAARRVWMPFLHGLGGTGCEREHRPVRQRIEQLLMSRYAWADSLANHYGQTFRSGYVANFGLAALAVGLALVGILCAPEAKIWLVIAELIVIIGILANTVFGVRQRWHDRWLDYRHLAERLRHGRILALLGAQPRMPRPAPPGASRGMDWVDWYVRTTMREIGLPNVRVDADYLIRCRMLLRDVELQEQIRYHHRTARSMHRLARNLHWLGYALFGATALICTIFILVYCWDFQTALATKWWVTFLTALLPTLGAAAYAVKVQGDFEGTCERSQATLKQLRAIRKALNTEFDTTDLPLAFARLTNRADQAAEAMLIDTADWRLVFFGRPLGLPA